MEKWDTGILVRKIQRTFLLNPIQLRKAQGCKIGHDTANIEWMKDREKLDPSIS